MKASEMPSENYLRRILPPNRIICQLPPPFSTHSTPYKSRNFQSGTVEFAKRAKSLLCMRIAKMILIGDSGVGKTTLLNKFCHGVFNANYKATIGVDFEVERFDVLDVAFSLQIWDTAGQERFRSIAKSYYRDSSSITVVFDMSDEATLFEAQKWLNDALEVNCNDPLIFLIGTKIDLLNSSDLKGMLEKATTMANQMKAELWLVSSKAEKSQVPDLFSRMAALAFEKVVQDQKPDEVNPIINIGDKLGSEDQQQARPQNNCCTAIKFRV